MHSTVVAAFVAILAASTSMAAPLDSRSSHSAESVSVTLSRHGRNGPTVTFGREEIDRSELSYLFPHAYDKVELKIGADFDNEALRCQILNEQGKPITITRGQNVDQTFADGGNGPWSFRRSKVSKIICDETFKKAAPPADGGNGGNGNPPPAQQPPRGNIHVRLSDGSEFARGHDLAGGVRSELPGPSGEWAEVSIIGGDPSQRCQILNERGQPIFVKRGGNTRETFANGPAWKIDPPQKVSRIICDPAFKI